MTGRGGERGGATQGTAEPTHESALAMPGTDPKTVEASTQDTKDDPPGAGAGGQQTADRKPHLATPTVVQPVKGSRADRSIEEATQGAEQSARAPEEGTKGGPSMATAPVTNSTPEKKKATTVSKKKAASPPKDDADIERVGVLTPPAHAAPGTRRRKPSANTSKEEEPAKLGETQARKEESGGGAEKRARCVSATTLREKKARTHASTGGATTLGTQTQGTGGAQTNTRRRRSLYPTDPSDRPDNTVQTEGSKKMGQTTLGSNKTGADTLDFAQRRRKKQLEKCKLMLTRNKQLVEVERQRGELEDHRATEDEQWFHGYLWRGDLDRMLKEDGQFLVRKSDWNGHEVYVISVMAQNTVINLLIKQTNTKKLFWVFNYAFRTVVELIDYHYRNNEPVDEASVYLRIPVFREDWQYSHEQIETATQLGSGNFGTVHNGYLKRHPFDPPVKVAIKTLTLEDDNMTASDKNEFLREANLMLAVDHPNLVKLFGLAATRMPIQIVMELCNETLQGKLKHHHHAWMFGCKDGMLKNEQKAGYVLDAARGLEYLHSCCIIHRDIAARNVLIRDGQAKISDFGLSIIGSSKKITLKNLPTKWCAPETLAQGTYSFHSDVFSFGALIYEVFSFGLPPYADFEAHRRGALRNFMIYGGQNGCKLDPIDPATPVWIKEMIDRCRQRDCYARPLFPDIVRKLETQLGPKAPSVGFWVSVRERFQKFIVDMISIGDYAAKEEEYIKAELDWLALHSSYEEWADPEAQEEMHKLFPYLPTDRPRQMPKQQYDFD